MLQLVRNIETLVWFIITAATAGSFWLAQGMTTDQADASNMWTTMLVFVIAFIKVRLVIQYFMEVRHAPLALRAVCEAWLLAACGAVLGLYYLGHTGVLTG